MREKKKAPKVRPEGIVPRVTSRGGEGDREDKDCRQGHESRKEKRIQPLFALNCTYLRRED
jgi:hypothetical protein